MKKATKASKVPAKTGNAVKKSSTVKKAATATTKVMPPEKADLMRQTIISVLWNKGELTQDALRSASLEKQNSLSPADFSQLFDEAMNMLRKYQLIESIPGRRTETLRLAHRLE